MIPRGEHGTVATVGTFDGLHRGHQEVLSEIVRRARQTGRRSVLVTFDPHPLKIVRPADAPPLLTTRAEKKELLAATGLDWTVFLRFTPALQRLSARDFVTGILIGRLGMRELVIGYDHGFGRDREGTVDTLRDIGRELDFAVDVVAPVNEADGAISSTRIRRALEQGDIAAAERGLGRPYGLRGVVERGIQRGRELGFPTANLRISDPDKLIPRPGIYAVHGLVGGARIPGLLHLGPRPTFPELAPTVELHLLDWSGDLYGAEVGVEFRAWLRGVLRFPNAAALVEQMQRDREAGLQVLVGGGDAGYIPRLSTS